MRFTAYRFLILFTLMISFSNQSQAQTGYLSHWERYFCNAVAVQGDYAYVSTDSKLCVVDISDPAKPALTGECVGYGRYLSVDNGMLVTAQADSFTFFNVADPLAPSKIKTWRLQKSHSRSKGFTINGIVIQGQNLIMATTERYDDYYNPYVFTIDISDPQNVAVLDAVEGGGGSSWSYFHDLSVEGDRAYVVDNYDSGISIYDISNKSNIRFLGSDWAWGYYNLDVNNNIAAITLADKLLLKNVSDPENITQTGSFQFQTNKIRDVIITKNYVYTLAMTEDVDETEPIRVFDFSDPSQVWEIGNYQKIDDIFSGFTDNTTYLFLTGRMGLYILPKNQTIGRPWTFTPDSYTRFTSPAIGPDGTVYVGAGNDSLYAFSIVGELKWTFKTVSGMVSPPSIGKDSTIYACSGQILYAIHPDGSEKWQIDTKDNLNQTPVLSSNGYLYYGAGSSLFAVNEQGTILWSVYLNGYSQKPCGIGPDGTVYACSSSILTAIYPSGVKKWEYKFTTNITSMPALDNDGTIYIGTSDKKLVAIYPDGTQKWNYETGGTAVYSPIIGPDRIIYFRASDNYLYSIHHDGSFNWKRKLNGSGYYTATIGKNGYIYIGSDDGRLYTLSSTGDELAAFDMGEYITSSPVIATNGMMYFSSGASVSAIPTQCKGLADSPWPRQYKDNLNTANAYNAYCPVIALQEKSIFINKETPTTVILDGSGSYDPNGDNLYYLWRVVSQPGKGTITLSDSTSPVIQAQLPAPKAGNSYRISLTVSDNDDGAASDFVEINVGYQWKQKLPSVQMAMANDQTIYGVRSYGELYAVNQYGLIETITDFDESISTPPVLAPDGTIYIGGNNLYAMDASGNEQWVFETIGSVSSIALDSDGTLYVTSENHLYAVGAGGVQKWDFKQPNNITGGPVIGTDGTIYVLELKYLHALTPDGKIKWTIHSLQGSPLLAVGGNSTIYMIMSGNIMAYHPDGAIKWSFQTSEMMYSAAIDTDETLYATGYKHLYAINPNGSSKWTLDIKSPDTPIIGSDGTIYIGSQDSLFYAIHPDGSLKWTFKTGSKNFTSPLIHNDGTLIFRDDQYLYAVPSESHGLADAPWPAAKRNFQNTANGYNSNCPVAGIEEDNVYLRAGGNVTLDGSVSLNPNGASLDYKWRILEQPENSMFVLDDSTSASINLEIPEEPFGRYNIALTVSNGQDGASCAVAQINVGYQWKLPLDTGTFSSYYTSPALSQDGSILMANQYGLTSILKSGQKNWYFNWGSNYGYSSHSPVIDSDGTIYMNVQAKNNDDGGGLLAITPEGNRKFYFKFDGSYYIPLPPAVTDSTIYFASKDVLYAVNKDSTLKWSYQWDNEIVSIPVISIDGTVYVYSNGLHAIDSKGRGKWIYDKWNSQDLIIPAIGADGTIYIGFGEGTPFAIASNGTLEWSFDMYLGETSPVIGPDQTIYVISQYGELFAVSPQGERNWRSRSQWEKCSSSSPLVGADGTIYYCTSDSVLRAVKPDGQELWTMPIGSFSNGTSPALDDDGILYVYADGSLYAIPTESQGLADSPWPTFGRNNQRTNSIQEYPPTSITNNETNIPLAFQLHQNYPNPFNPLTRITYALPRKSYVKINIYDLTGRLIKTLVDREMPAGTHSATWDAGMFASGVYFYRIETDSFSDVKKCLLLK